MIIPWVTIYFCSPTHTDSKQLGSGLVRVRRSELGEWLIEQSKKGILIVTEIKEDD